jgi:DNA processing protein
MARGVFWEYSEGEPGRFGCLPIPAADIPELPEEEAVVFAAVTADESPVDRIIERCGLPAHVVSVNLMKLELRRLVRAFPGFRYARR